MNPHVIDWLPAYHDGELSPSRRRHVEEHLRGCDYCRTELHAIASLSSLLKADAAPQLTPAERFAAQVGLQLPRRAEAYEGESPASRPPRWLVWAPLALILVGAFVRAGLGLTDVLLSAAPFLGLRAASFVGGSSYRNIETLLVLNLGLLAGVAVLWSAWMAFWWAWTRHQGLEFDHLEKEV